MRGTGVKHILAENLRATSSQNHFNKNTSLKKRMCWKCQKDKPTLGGHIKMFTGGTMKFICKDCMDAKKEKTNG